VPKVVASLKRRARSARTENHRTQTQRTGNLKPRNPRRRIVQWLLLFVASVIVVDGLVGERGLLAILRARHEYDDLAATIARQRAENARLREEARRLKDDPAAIEEVARRDLGLIRPGERVFIIKDVTPPKP
jgi:cell division protein FtsB